MIMRPGIYKITNIQNEKFYIGSTNNLSHRKSIHLYDLRNNRHKNIHLQRSYNKWGYENFTFEVLEECTVENLINREQFYLDTLKPQYNILKIAGSSLGIKRPELSIKMIELNKNRVVSEETKKRTSDTLKQIGHKPTADCTEKSMQILRKKVLQYSIEGELLQEYVSMNEACRQNNIACSNLSRACQGIIKTLGGYKWNYKNN